MFRWMVKGIMPSEEEVKGKMKGKTTAGEPINLDRSDFIAMFIALCQTILPFALGFLGVYLLFILFLTNVWLK